MLEMFHNVMLGAVETMDVLFRPFLGGAAFRQNRPPADGDHSSFSPPAVIGHCHCIPKYGGRREANIHFVVQIFALGVGIPYIW
jgi:hypothetical protein